MQRWYKKHTLVDCFPQTTILYCPPASHPFKRECIPRLLPYLENGTPSKCSIQSVENHRPTDWEKYSATFSGNHIAASAERLCSVAEVSPINRSMSWEVTHVSGLLTEGAAIYTIPTVELDDDDEQWFQFGFSMARKVLDSHGDHALVLFETVQAGEEATFPEFWVATHLLDESFILSPA
jgi:hypothetical protein